MSKEESRRWRRRLAGAYLSSVISISLSLLLIGVASLVLINAGELTRYLKENMRLSVVMNVEVSEDEAGEYIKTISTYPFVRETSLITREQGERELSEMLGEDFLSVFETSPVPVSVDVKLQEAYVHPDSLALVQKSLESSPLVEDVDSQKDLVQALNANITRIGMVLGVFVLLLLFISFVLINNMVRLSVYARRFTIHTMKLVGATRSFILAPFLRKAVVQGVVASLVASAAMWGIYYIVRGSAPEIFMIFRLSTLAICTAIILVCGLLVCVLSTFFVVSKLVKASKDDLYY